MKTMLTFVVVLAAACGGSKTPASSGPGPSATATTTGAGEHANMSPEITRFHDVLAPRWHAEKGPQRKTDTCAVVPQLQTNATALASSTPPGSAQPSDWSTATKELTVAVGGLEAACKASPNDFESAFERVHTVFHAVMELSNAKAGEHDHKAGEHNH